MNPRGGWYEIRVAEPLESWPLDSWWSQWFAGLEILPAGEPDAASEQTGPGTVLRGCVPDQAALFGLLGRVRDLNLTLLEVKRIADI